MEREKLFRSLVAYACDNSIDVSKQYIGLGNPYSKVLIIGKENAIDKKDDLGKEKYSAEVENNSGEWRSFINDCERKIQIGSDFFSVRRGYLDENGNAIIPKRGTWKNYKKLVEIICKDQNWKCYEKNNFFDMCFMTEMNAFCAKESKKIKESDRKASIDKRIGKEGILTKDFYRSFEIVIVAAGSYVEKYGKEFVRLFSKNQKIVVTPQLSTENYISIESIATVIKHLYDTGMNFADLRNNMTVESDNITKLKLSNDKILLYENK